MTQLVTSTTVTEDDGLVTLIHLDVDDAYECLRINFCEEVPRGDINGIINSMEAQELHFDVAVHEVDLTDVRVEFPSAQPAGPTT